MDADGSNAQVVGALTALGEQNFRIILRKAVKNSDSADILVCNWDSIYRLQFMNAYMRQYH